jgi:HTH-type transcriptional regulator, competence development regulator
MKGFKEIIRESRISNGIILREVSASIGIDQTIINKYELGERKPTKEQVIKLANFYSINTEELIIAWKSDILSYELCDEENASKILKLAEDKVKYLKMNRS